MQAKQECRLLYGCRSCIASKKGQCSLNGTEKFLCLNSVAGPQMLPREHGWKKSYQVHCILLLLPSWGQYLPPFAIRSRRRLHPPACPGVLKDASACLPQSSHSLQVTSGDCTEAQSDAGFTMPTYSPHPGWCRLREATGGSIKMVGCRESKKD